MISIREIFIAYMFLIVERNKKERGVHTDISIKQERAWVDVRQMNKGSLGELQ